MPARAWGSALAAKRPRRCPDGLTRTLTETSAGRTGAEYRETRWGDEVAH